jgi:hypothetical protein
MLKIPADIREILYQQNWRTSLAKFLPASLQGVYAVICQRALVDDTEMIRTQMGTHNISENGRSCMGLFVRYHPVTVKITTVYYQMCVFHFPFIFIFGRIQNRLCCPGLWVVQSTVICNALHCHLLVMKLSDGQERYEGCDGIKPISGPLIVAFPQCVRWTHKFKIPLTMHKIRNTMTGYSWGSHVTWNATVLILVSLRRNI